MEQFTHLTFGAPETYTDKSDIEGDAGATFHQDPPHKEIVRDRDSVWGEPWDEAWFLPTKVTPTLDERLRFPPPAQTRNRDASVDFSEDYEGSGLDVSPPPVQPTERHKKRRRIEPNYIEDFIHLPENAQPQRPLTPYGSQRRAEFWYGDLYTLVPKNWHGIVYTASDQQLYRHGVLAWDTESFLEVQDFPDNYEIWPLRVPFHFKHTVGRINPNTFVLEEIPYTWFKATPIQRHSSEDIPMDYNNERHQWFIREVEGPGQEEEDAAMHGGFYTDWRLPDVDHKKKEILYDPTRENLQLVANFVHDAGHTLVDFAHDRLQEWGLFDKDSDYGGMLGEAVMELVETFSDQGHSGMSAALTRQVFNTIFDAYDQYPLKRSFTEEEMVAIMGDLTEEFRKYLDQQEAEYVRKFESSRNGGLLFTTSVQTWDSTVPEAEQQPEDETFVHPKDDRRVRRRGPVYHNFLLDHTILPSESEENVSNRYDNVIS